MPTPPDSSPFLPDDASPWFPLGTARLRLREFRDEDLEDIHAYGGDPQVSRFMDWGPNTPKDSRDFLDRQLKAQGAWPRPDVSLAIELKATGKVIGAIRLWVVDAQTRTAELGYSLGRAHWRQGIATEAAHAMLDAGFRTLGLHRIIATCDVRNRGSWGVMRKLGMRREGRMRQERQAKGAWRDTYLYAVLAHEYLTRV
jgi:ribosomal-protein-alanine N-acetyltransferase